MNDTCSNFALRFRPAKRPNRARFEKRADFTAIARGFGVDAERAERAEEIAPLLERAMSHQGPFLAEIMVDETANVFPMVAPGSANRNMIGG